MFISGTNSGIIHPHHACQLALRRVRVRGTGHSSNSRVMEEWILTSILVDGLLGSTESYTHVKAGAGCIRLGVPEHPAL